MLWSHIRLCGLFTSNLPFEFFRFEENWNLSNQSKTKVTTSMTLHYLPVVITACWWSSLEIVGSFFWHDGYFNGTFTLTESNSVEFRYSFRCKKMGIVPIRIWTGIWIRTSVSVSAYFNCFHNQIWQNIWIWIVLGSVGTHRKAWLISQIRLKNFKTEKLDWLLRTLWKWFLTRMHSSRMHTARLLTYPSMHCWGVYLPGGVPAWGVYLPGGCTCPGGVPARGWCICLGDVPAGGCTYLGGVPAWGVYLPRGGGVPAQVLSPPPVNRMTDVQKYYLAPDFVCGR